jgi:hypothetical protein
MLAEAMQHVLSDAAARTSMRAAGLEQARAFTWDRTAHRTVASYRQALMPRKGKHGV